MTDFLENCFSGPNLPATVLLIMVCMYWIMVMVGALGLEMFDFDLDVDADLEFDSGLETVLSTGLVGLRFLNIGNVPLMLWMSFFAISLWTITLFLDQPSYHESWWTAALVVLRNSAISLVPTKLLTQPMKGKFDPVEPNTAEDLIGAEVVVTTSEVTPSSGQARMDTEAAPLLLNVRSVQGVIAKGDRAIIVEFDETNHIYRIERASPKQVQEV